MYRPMSPVDFLARSRRVFPDKVAVVDGDAEYTYSELGERVDRFSNALLDMGITRGDKVAIISPNTHEMLESFFSLPQIGAVLVPINYRLTGGDFLYIIEHSESKAVLVDYEYAPLLESVAGDLKKVERFILTGGGDYRGSLPVIKYEEVLEGASEGAPPDAGFEERDIITINYTSGTTANPKGVMLTHRACYLNACDYLIHLRVVYQDVYLHTLPMFHANGWGGIWALAAIGGTQICLRKVEAKPVYEAMQGRGVTLACCAPTVLVTLASYEGARDYKLARSLRIGTGGAAPPATVLKNMEELGVEVIHLYGLTETGPFLTTCVWKPEWDELPLEERYRLKARQGVPQVLVDVRVMDEGMREVPNDGVTVGEIVARGNVIMEGYYKQKDETAKAFEGGWFHTGDLAVVHPDNYIEITDRKKDVILGGGENISSVEVENTLYQHPAVLEAAVVGVPDERWGEAPKALVVFRQGKSATEQELIQFCRQKMAHFKAPKSVEFVKELPKTATGKVQKFALREKYWEGREKRVQG